MTPQERTGKAGPFDRTEMLLGPEALARLANARVAVFGLGGVGSFAAEALARAGVGTLVLVDRDIVDVTNLNRQIIALHSTLGRPKVDVMAERIADINPAARVERHFIFYLPGEGDALFAGCDYVVDAVDTVAAKLSLVMGARAAGVPIISAMSCGDKLDPTGFAVADVFDTQICPLCRVMRKELHRRGIDRLKVVYSQEKSAAHRVQSPPDPVRRHVPGSLPFVPSVAGLILAGEVIRDLCGALWPAPVAAEGEEDE